MEKTAEEQNQEVQVFQVVFKTRNSSKSDCSVESKAFDSNNGSVTFFFHQTSVLQFLSDKQEYQLLINFI